MKTTLAGMAGTVILGNTTNSLANAGKTSSVNLTGLTLAEAADLLHAKKVSPVELTNACLERIQQLNPKLNAFITITGESALHEARAAEAEIQRGNWRGPLHGIPIALKDLVDTAGVRTTAASGLFKDRVPTQDAEIVRRLKAAGAVFLGKLNMHEFAFGGSSVISFFGPVHNPWNPAYCTGGSSGGSAAAVSAGLCYAAIGSDTGGSVRQPAAYCGIVGLKPTYGVVSTRGAIPLSWYLDHLGPMTRTVRDAALMLQVIAGYDREEMTSIETPIPDYTATIAAATSQLRVGVPRAYFYDEIDSEIQAALGTALAVLQKLTASVRDIKPLATDEKYSSLVDPCRTVLGAEAYAYHQDWISKTPELYQPETLKRIRAGADIATPTYIRSRRQLDQYRRSISQVFDSVDALVTPTTAVPPFSISDLGDPATLRTKELLMLRNTRPFNGLGLPTISVPCGFTRTGLPIGMQITGRAGEEATVLRLADAYELATEWHKRQPSMSVAAT